MFKIEVRKFETKEGDIHIATIEDSTSNAFLSHKVKGDANDAATGLILDIGRFKTEAIAAISKHLREEKG